MSKIIINGRFLTQKITGVQRYAREICSELDKLIGKDEIIMAVPPEIQEIPAYQNIRIVKTGKLHNRMWEHISFPLYVWRKGGISLNLCNVAPLASPGIVCIHDMKIKATPQFFSKKFLLWYNMLFENAVRRAKVIITVSQFSKDEIIKYYGVSADKIYVIPNAWQHFERIAFDDNALQKYGLCKHDYYFAMASLEPNKNFQWIAQAAKTNPTVQFAVAGAINTKVFKEGLGFDCPANMKLLGYVSDAEAKTLMRDCRAFLFPSFYEGFGIPPLESMSAGCRRIIVSDTPVMHEIFKSSVEYIDPFANNTKFENNYSDKSTQAAECLARFSWQESARKMIRMLNKMEE